ncbi:MAG: ABC transporter permease subunit, partial [Thermoleophilia bacterium]|nr:ABC transporter permease subunit [Thermoleophilia bacterium]
MRDELARQLARRRTRLVLALMLFIPLALVMIYVVRGAPELAPGATPSLQQLADGSALAFTSFVLYLCAPLLLVAVAALFAGDSVASEASWGTLRYLLAAPVARRRLLARKLFAALALTALALVLLAGTSLVAGLLAFGWHPLDTSVGGITETGPATWRLLFTLAYVFISLLPFAAIALWFSTLVDAPLAPVAGSVGVAVVAQI